VFAETLSPAMQNRFHQALLSQVGLGPTFLGPQMAPEIFLGFGPVISTSFYPSQPLRVDELALLSQPSRAVLTKPALRGQVRGMDLQVQAVNGNWEEFTLFFLHQNPKEQPARREVGSVFFARKEFIGP